MVKKRGNSGNRLEKAEQENRTLVLKYLNLKYHGASPDYKKGFREGIEFFKEFPNAGLEMIWYLENVEHDQ